MAVNRTVQRNTDIWILDGTRTTRFTFDAAFDGFPAWSPDGSRMVFGSDRKGPRNLYVKPSNGAGIEELLLESAQPKLPANRKPRVFLKTNFDEDNSQFSPEGRWAAYMSNESGRSEIYVRPFVEPAAAGERRPDWRAVAGLNGGRNLSAVAS